MKTDSVPSVGGKDLQDFRHLSHSPEVGYLQKQSLPDSPRTGAEPAPTAFQQLKTFVSENLLGWITQYLRYRIGSKHEFLTYHNPDADNGIYPLSGGQDEPVRVVAAGDWGTGTDEAHRVAHLMEARDPHYTLHLGDVYFVGDPDEVKENFLGIANPKLNYTPCKWPVGSKGAFALNGNHEMYALGHGYFDLILPMMGLRSGDHALGQKASFFCLENAHWRVIALDTGYNSIGFPGLEQIFQPDCALPEPLLAWLRDILKQKDDKRGIVLLSHHQYASRYDGLFVRPAEQLAQFIDRPVIWLWGHEHRLAIYEKFQRGQGITAYGRCIGHGGMPVDLPGQVKHSEIGVEFVDQRKYDNDEGLDIGVNGFAALTFSGDRLKIEYVDAGNAVIFWETWRTDPAGGLTRDEVWKMEQGGA